MLGAGGRRASFDPIYLLTGRRPPEDPARARAAPVALRRRVDRDRSQRRAPAATRPSPPATRSVSSPATAGGSSIVEDVERWKKADEEAVAGYVADPVQGAVLALVAGETQGLLAAGALRQGGEVLTFDVPRPRDLPSWVRAQFERLGVQADADAARALVEIVGDDATALATEVEKLAAWSGGEPSGAARSSSLAAPAHEASAWAIMDAWGARDLPGALAACQSELEHGADPFAIAMRLSSQVGARAPSRRLSPRRAWARKDIAKRLRKHEFRVRKALGHAENYTRDELDEAVIRLAALDAALKGCEQARRRARAGAGDRRARASPIRCPSARPLAPGAPRPPPAFEPNGNPHAWRADRDERPESRARLRAGDERPPATSSARPGSGGSRASRRPCRGSERARGAPWRPPPRRRRRPPPRAACRASWRPSGSAGSRAAGGRRSRRGASAA